MLQMNGSLLCALTAASFLAGCGKEQAPPATQAAADAPELTVIFAKKVRPEEAIVMLPEFGKKAEMRGCQVKTESGEADAVLAKCGDYVIVMARHGSDVIVACDPSTDSGECRELALQILQSGEPQLVARGTTDDDTLLPRFKKAMVLLGCRDAGSSGDNVNMACAVGLVSLVVEGRNATFVCVPFHSANCVAPVKEALGL